MEKIKEGLFRIRKIIAIPVVKTINSVLDKIGIAIENGKSIEQILKSVEGKKVAIIGNSPILENSGHGKKIDSYDIVIRLNKGILKGFLDKENTGEKTDIWSTIALDTTLSPKIIAQNIKTKGEIDIIIPYEKKDIKMLILNLLYNNEKAIVPEEIIQEMKKLLGGKTPSTGFVLIWLFLKYSNANEIGIFGFSFSDFNRINGCRSLTESHNFQLEEVLIKELVEKNSDKLKLFR